MDAWLGRRMSFVCCIYVPKVVGDGIGGRTKAEGFGVWGGGVGGSWVVLGFEVCCVLDHWGKWGVCEKGGGGGSIWVGTVADEMCAMSSRCLLCSSCALSSARLSLSCSRFHSTSRL